jgi:hypothetical protein
MDDGDMRKETGARWVPWAAAFFILAAVAVRLYRIHCSSLGTDGSICGLLGLGAINGRWPLFFYGQDFMGALEGYLSGPIYALFGTSTITLNIWAPILTIATMVVLYLCLRRYMRPLPCLVALAYMAIPAAVAYFHAGKPNNHYPLGILLCALLMWFTFKLWEEKPWRSLTALGWGLMAGLAFWTNFQTVVVIWACMLFLAITSLPRLRPLPLLSGIIGAAIGAGPLINYNALHHWEHSRQSGSFALKYIIPHWEMFWQNALPIALGFNTPAASGPVAPGSPWFALYLAVAGLMVLGILLLIWRGLRTEGRWALLPVLVMLISAAVLVSAIYGRELYDWDQRYMLPFYLGLPFVWAALAQALSRWGKAAVLVFGALLLTLNVSGWAHFGGGCLTCGWRPFRSTVEVKEKKFINQLRQAGFSGLYFFNDEVYRLAFFAGESPQFANAWRDRRQYAADQVDADPKAAIMADIDAPLESLRFLGLAHKVWRDHVAYDFQPPQGAAEFLARDQWTFSGVGGTEPGRSLMDGSLQSGLGFLGKEGIGKGFVLDLGASQMVGGLVLLPPDFRSAPGNLTVEAAGPDGRFEMIRKMTDAWQPLYWSALHPFFKTRYPRVECYFPPREIRYLRVTQQAERKVRYPSLIGEVMLLGPARQAPVETGWLQSGNLVAEMLRGKIINKVYADAWLSAFLREKLGSRVWSLPANYNSDDYGSPVPPAEEPLLMDVAPGNALVVPVFEARQAQAALSRAGVSFQSRQTGRFTIIMLDGPARPQGKPLPLKAVSSPIDPPTAAQLAKGVPDKGRWGSLVPQKPGMSLTLDLGKVQPIGRLYIWNPHFPRDFARGLAFSLSDDSLNWREAAADLIAPLVYSGRGVLAAPVGFGEYAFVKPQNARYLRLALTRSIEPWWWSVERLEVFPR